LIPARDDTRDVVFAPLVEALMWVEQLAIEVDKRRLPLSMGLGHARNAALHGDQIVELARTEPTYVEGTLIPGLTRVGTLRTQLGAQWIFMDEIVNYQPRGRGQWKRERLDGYRTEVAGRPVIERITVALTLLGAS
jgi:hypothetical protein